MFRTLTSQYPGTCKRCQQAFAAGTRIRYGGRGRTYHLKADCPAGTVESDTDESLPETARYAATAGHVSDELVIGGKAFYRNKRGRCEDAPCCGCCTV